MIEDHGAQNPENYSRSESEVVYKNRNVEERGAQRVRSWTGQNEMKSVPS